MNGLVAVARAVADRWLSEVALRRKISKHDPVAEALEFCASELAEELRMYDAPDATCTVLEFAREHGVSGACVRRWARVGKVDAIRTPKGYRIKRGQQVRQSA